MSEVKPHYLLTNVNFYGWARFVDDESGFSGYRALMTAEVAGLGTRYATRYAYACVTDHEYAEAVMRGEFVEYLHRLVRLAYRVLEDGE